MSLVGMVRNSARQANERKASDLAERLDAIRTQEIRSTEDLIAAFSPLVDMMADLMRDVDSGRAATADMLDRMQSALNKMEHAMNQAPTQLQEALTSSTEGQAVRLEGVAEAMERLSKMFRGKLAEGLKSAGETGKALKEAQADASKLVPQMQAAVSQMKEAATEAGKRRFLGPLAMVVITALLSSALSAWLVSRMTGLPLRWPL